MKVSVSFFKARKIKKILTSLNQTSADFIHVDVADKKFVKTKSDPFWKLDLYQNLYRDKRLDVHLMVEDPLKYIKKYARLDTNFISFHVEVNKDIDSLIDLIHEMDIKAGLAISPSTPLYNLEPYLDKIDLIILMGVEPGLSGQTFIKETCKRLKDLKKMVKNKNILITVDGGINNETKELVKDADILVSSSYVLSGDYEERIKSLK